MNKKILLFLLFLPILYAQAEQCVKCEEVQSLTPTSMVVIPDETNHILTINLYNATSRQPLPNAVIIIYRYNNTTRAFEKVLTDEQGRASYDFAAYKEDCYTYQILFCSCDKDAVKECCLEINNIDATKPNTPNSMDDVPLAPNQPQLEPSEIIYNYHAFPSTEIYSYCKPGTEAATTPAFCLPLAIIFALLGGSLMLTGRNPFRGFDLGGIRLGKHIKYESRGRFAGYTVSVAQISGVIRKAKAETAESKAAKEPAEGKAAPKGRISMIADRFRRQVIAPIKNVPAGLTQAKGAMAAGREDLARRGVKGIGSQYADAGKVLAKAFLQAVGTPIDAIRTSTGGPEIMFDEKGRPIPMRRRGGAEAGGAEPTGIFALLGLVPGVDAKGLQDKTYQLLKTKGELMAEKMMLQDALRLLNEKRQALTVSSSITEKGKKEEKEHEASFTLKPKEVKKINGYGIIKETKTPDGKNALVAEKTEGKEKHVFLIPEGTHLYKKFMAKANENANVVGGVIVEIAGKGTYHIEKDENGKMHVYEEGRDITKMPEAKDIISTNKYNEFLGDTTKKSTIIQESGRYYQLEKNPEGKISIYEIGREITKDSLGAGIIAAYKEITKTNKEFDIGKESERLSSYNEALGEWQKARAVVQNSQMAFVASAMGDIKEDFLKQPGTIEKADEVVINKIKKTMESDVEKVASEFHADYKKWITQSGEINTDQLFAEIEKAGIAGKDKEMLYRREGYINSLKGLISAIKDYEKATTPEKIKEHEQEITARTISPAKAQPTELEKIRQDIKEYIEKARTGLNEMTDDLTRGMPSDKFENTMAKANALSEALEFLENRVELDNREKAVSIAVKQLTPEDETALLKRPNHPFTGAVFLEKLTNKINERYSEIYKGPGYKKPEMEYEKKLDEFVAAEAVILDSTKLNKERVMSMNKTLESLDKITELKAKPSEPSQQKKLEESKPTDDNTKQKEKSPQPSQQKKD